MIVKLWTRRDRVKLDSTTCDAELIINSINKQQFQTDTDIEYSLFAAYSDSH